MGVPVSQMWTVASYVWKQKLAGRKRYPLVLMLEPLFRCNLACAGCGKIQYPAHILKAHLTPEECFRAVEECGAPMVSIPGGEPLMHPQIKEIVEGLVARKKYVYLCTNALLLKEKIDLFQPSKYLSFSIHMDGQKEHHDLSVCREGGYDLAVEGLREAVKRGFRVTTNTTLFEGADPNSVRDFFDEMMELGVDDMMLSPGYSYEKAPDQQHFLGKNVTRKLFRSILSNRKSHWRFNQSPLFLEFLMGHRDFSCTPWGMPTFNLFGWQKPCYLMQDGYADTFAELMEATEWERYGTESGNPKCANCMVHSGYEASASHALFTTWNGFFGAVRGFFAKYPDAAAREALKEPRQPVHPPDLVQISVASASENLQGRAWGTAKEDELREGLEKAFDYRGDVTVTMKDGRTLEGYLSDRRSASTLHDSMVQIVPKDQRTKVNLSYADVAGLDFTGRDTAAGKSWEAWMKKYWEKKAAGEQNIALTPENID